MVPEKVLLLKYGEIALKGLNKAKFEKLLENNMKTAFKNHGYRGDDFIVQKEQSVMIISCNPKSENNNIDMENVVPIISKVFGIAAINLALKTEKNIDLIKEAAGEYVAPLIAGKSSFAVNARRSDKRFPLKSPEIAAEVGDVLFELNNGEVKVDLKNPEVKVTIEVRDNDAFVYTKKYRGAGGMPVGSNGKGLLLLSGGIDSPVAGYMMARRGLEISALHFTSEPYTSPRSKEKVIRLAKLVADYGGHIDFYSISLTEIQEQIKKNCNPDYLILILRRFMMELAEKCAIENKFNCIVTGESLGQVASQTIEAINATNDGIKLPILRPCIGLDKYQIIEIAEKIGTYETSIEPFDDCCTVFTPRHPVTRPKMYAVLAEENKLDREFLIAEAYKSIEKIDSDKY